MLREWISSNATTQTEFAEQAEISAAYLCQILGGQRGMSLKVAKRISRLTGIPIEALPDRRSC